MPILEFAFMEKFISTFYDAATLGAIYALIAVGYTMVYGIIKLINFAHGEIIMVGAFVSLLASQKLAASMGVWALAAAVPTAMGCCAMLGATIDWMAYLPLRRKKRWSDLISAFAVVLAAGMAVLYFISGGTGPLASERLRGGLAVALLLLPGLFALLLFLDHAHALERPRRLIAVDRLNALIVAIGMSLYLQTLAQLIWGARYHALPEAAIPAFFSAQVPGTEFRGAALQWKQAIVWLTALALMLFLSFIVRSTRLGRAMRATALDKQTAALMGVNVDRVIIATFMIGSAMAAVAGALLAVKVGGNISYRMGYYPGVIAFAAAVLGGIGNINGAAAGGLLIGLAQAFGMTYVSSELDFVFGFGIMILVIAFRPWGLFGRPDAARA